MRTRTTLAVLGTASALVASVVAASPAANAVPARSPKAVPNTKPAWTAHAQTLGRANGHARVTARVYLAPRGGLAAVRAAAQAMATPGNAAYHKFLTPAQYRSRFGTTTATVHAVESWLSSAGLRVTGVGAQNRYVAIAGTVAQAEHAFGTSLRRYRHSGQTVQAPATAVTVPGNLAGTVLTVTGLDTTTRKMTPAVKPPAGYRNAHPCSVYYGQLKAKYEADYKTTLPRFDGKVLPYAPCGYTGPQFRAAYEGNTKLTGAGVGVAIVDAYASNHMAKDARTYAANNGDAPYAPGQYSEVINKPFTHAGNGPNGCGASGWSGEESLDVEAVHAMAPAARIVYYGAASCYDSDLLNALGEVVDQDAVQLVTNSWGEPGEYESADQIAAYEQVFLQGATEGISFMFSSGDNGDELANTGIKQTDYPTSDPYVTSVGGTAMGIGASGNVLFQTGWGTERYGLSTNGASWTPSGYMYGAGGGYSSLFNRPAYQDGTVQSSYRGVPDVSMDADPNTGMLIGLTQTFSDGTYYDQYRIGGTSLASPLFTGMTALKVQAEGGTGFGLLNPTIYASNNRAEFTDVKHTPAHPGDVRVDFANGENASGGLLYSVRTFDQDASLTTGKGWDDVTGIGSPNPGWLAK